MKMLLFLPLTLFLNACVMGSFTLPDYKEDIPAENLAAYKKSEKTFCEEKFSFAPVVWFKVDSVRKAGDNFNAENFTMGPLYIYSHAKQSNYDKDGKQLFYSSWGSYLWGVLGDYYVRRYREEDAWIEEKHVGWLLGLFGHSNTREGRCLSILFIPIPLGE
jgi:hypothetical protein